MPNNLKHSTSGWKLDTNSDRFSDSCGGSADGQAFLTIPGSNILLLQRARPVLTRTNVPVIKLLRVQLVLSFQIFWLISYALHIFGGFLGVPLYLHIGAVVNVTLFD